MSQLFGLDISNIVFNAINSAGGLNDAMLVKLTKAGRDPNNPTRVLPPTETSYGCQGFIEMREVRRRETLVTETISVVTILGASLPDDVVPDVNDKVTFGNLTMTLVQLMERDPASAIYEFEAA